MKKVTFYLGLTIVLISCKTGLKDTVVITDLPKNVKTLPTPEKHFDNSEIKEAPKKGLISLGDSTLYITENANVRSPLSNSQNESRIQQTFTKLALFDEDSLIREKAVIHLMDEEVLRSVAYHDSSRTVRKQATAKIINAASLKHIAYFDSDSEIRKIATNKITNEEALLHIALFDESPEVRKLATSKINSIESLSRIAEHDEDKAVRSTALNRLIQVKK